MKERTPARDCVQTTRFRRCALRYFVKPAPPRVPALMLMAAAFLMFFPSSARSQNTPCRFEPTTLQFTGSPVEQARCLLRPNGRGGVLGAGVDKLPDPIGKLPGTRTVIQVTTMRRYLMKENIDETAIGGDLDLPLATAKLPSGEVVPALYFIIHDTSWPYLKDADFPAAMNTDETWQGNKIDIWTKNPVAHIFVDRLGRSIATTPFSEPVRKGWGTKFSRDFLKTDGKGFQIHIELVQPRRRDSSDRNLENDLIAPVAGFSNAQYERLALLYIAASVRRGSWLIPAYHSAIDAGIKDAHDDPQNFELNAFARAIRKLVKKIK